MSKLDLSVTRENIESVLSTLPDDILAWGEKLAESLNKQYLAEQKLAFVRAKTNIAIRQMPTDYGMSKVTEDSVKVLVEAQKEVREAESEYAAARTETNNVRAVTDALDAKRSACKYLSELWLSGRLG